MIKLTLWILFQTGVEKLNFALEEHVSDHYEDLINQATGMDILEEVRSVVNHQFLAYHHLRFPVGLLFLSRLHYLDIE